jgi:meiotically up-regulated gene 157 (Mug157) protein
MAQRMRADVDRVFIAEYKGRQIYAYAADAHGNFRFYHDANDLPLAWAPAWGFVASDDPIWRATIQFAFSSENAEGFYDGRLGSVHTPAPWPLGNIQQLIVARAIGDPELERLTQTRLRSTAQWDGALPEAYEAITGRVFSRHWFAWPNAALYLAFAGQQR